MSLSAKRESLARIHGRYQRAGRPHKSRILDEFCATCGYHRQSALRLLNRPLRAAPPKRSGPKIIYEPAQVRPVLKAVWLASDQLCSKLLQAALPEWLAHYERRSAPLGEAFKKKLLEVSPAQMDRLLQSARVQHPRKGLCTTRPGTLLRHAVPTRGGPPDTGNEWSQFTNHFKPTFKLLKREKQGGKTKRVYETTPTTPYQRLLDSPDIPAATKEKLRAQHAQLDPFALKKNIELKLTKFFTVLGNLNREATMP